MWPKPEHPKENPPRCRENRQTHRESFSLLRVTPPSYCDAQGSYTWTMNIRYNEWKPKWGMICLPEGVSSYTVHYLFMRCTHRLISHNNRERINSTAAKSSASRASGLSWSSNGDSSSTWQHFYVHRLVRYLSPRGLYNSSDPQRCQIILCLLLSLTYCRVNKSWFRENRYDQ